MVPRTHFPHIEATLNVAKESGLKIIFKIMGLTVREFNPNIYVPVINCKHSLIWTIVRNPYYSYIKRVRNVCFQYYLFTLGNTVSGFIQCAGRQR